jgi:hypothetical protein
MENKINNLYREYDELDNQYEDEENQGRKDKLADQRDKKYEEMKQLIKKYLKNGKDYKKLDVSNNWKEKSFGGKKNKIKNIGSRAQVMLKKLLVV